MSQSVLTACAQPQILLPKYSLSFPKHHFVIPIFPSFHASCHRFSKILFFLPLVVLLRILIFPPLLAHLVVRNHILQNFKIYQPILLFSPILTISTISTHLLSTKSKFVTIFFSILKASLMKNSHPGHYYRFLGGTSEFMSIYSFQN